MNETRRRLIALAGLAPMAVLGARQVFAQAKPVCYDPATLTLSQESMRESVGFVDPATNPAERCGVCAFFVATRGECGTCQILSGGPTAQSAYCTSFAPKA